MNNDIRDYWHPTRNGDLKSDQVTPSSRRKVWWICDRGHEYQARIQDRKRSGGGCPYCAGRKVLAGFNDLATVNPSLASQWHPTKNEDLTPEMVSKGSKKRVWWQCTESHQWQATIKDRTAGTGCPECARRGKKPYEDDLATTHPHLVPQWHPTKNGALTPSYVTANSVKHVWWICDLGHEWKATPVTRAVRGEGCPVCSGKTILPGFNDLATKFPEIAAQWHPELNAPLTPDHISPNSGRKVWWICDYGHEWQATVMHRVRHLSGCPDCSGITKG